MKILYRPSFIRDYDKLSPLLKEEVREKIALFRENPRHPFLKAHKLKGRLKGCLSFSVNYQYRIVFIHVAKTAVALLTVGDHDIYR